MPGTKPTEQTKHTRTSALTTMQVAALAAVQGLKIGSLVAKAAGANGRITTAAAKLGVKGAKAIEKTVHNSILKP